MSVDHPDIPYEETADIESSNDDYATRFAGPVGEWMLSVQESITLDFIRQDKPSSILDVGGGHGQLAIPLTREGYPVTVLSSHESCKKRIQNIVDTGQCRFVVGDVIHLPFDDKSFDTVISFRMLTHCEKWPQLIKELCRVAQHTVIVDYPTSQSMNAIAPMFFKAKKKIETNTRTWKLLRHNEVWAEFTHAGFKQEGRKAQFFLPMVVHRALKTKALSTFAEGLCRVFGLTHFWGSPVIIKMKRVKS
jgi:ubiquinone/menaquinone biosynthesis C-methylase UbiE